MRRFNVFRAEPGYDADDPDGYRAGASRFGESIGASLLGGTLYELPAGQSVCPYHYEHGDEELLLVLAGRPSLRHAEGEDELEPGDVVCFPAGPGGAHKVTNRAAEPVRLVMFSTRRLPAVVVYPDSDKIGVFTGAGRDDLMVRREAGVGYWDRED